MGGVPVGETPTQIRAPGECIASRAGFATSLFHQRRCTADDLVTGDACSDCSVRTASEDAVCRCNEGGQLLMFAPWEGRPRHSLALWRGPITGQERGRGCQ